MGKTTRDVGEDWGLPCAAAGAPRVSFRFRKENVHRSLAARRQSPVAHEPALKPSQAQGASGQERGHRLRTEHS